MIESISDFYRRIGRADLVNPGYSDDKPYFNIQPVTCQMNKISFSYRDFYKVGLVLETGKLYYADKWIMVDRPALVVSNPLVPYAWEALGKGRGTGYYCIFNEAFIMASEKKGSLANTPLFDLSKERIYFLDDNCLNTIQEIFEKMDSILTCNYSQKLDIMRCYLHLLIHEVIRLQPTYKYATHRNASQRIVELFLTLLDRQFPVHIPNKTLMLKTATDYSDRLSVHVNHLNRIIKQVTGRTTTDLINGRIVQESVQLLRHTTFSIAEIGFALGFEEPASFSNFIKKHTNLSPKEHRVRLVD